MLFISFIIILNKLFFRSGMERYELKVEHIGLRWGERLAGATTQAMETRRPYVQQVTNK